MVSTDPSTGVSATIAHVPPQPATVACTQPVAGSHETAMQELLSPQSSGDPPTQAPAKHVSPVVQALSSEQGSELFAYSHPTAASQSSVVHGLLSSQLTAAPGWHVPDAH